MILKLSRTRDNDPCLSRKDKIGNARRRHAGRDSPAIFTEHFLGASDVDNFVTELDMPDITTRLGMNAQDPLSSVHYFDFCIYVLLPAAFGLRMCFNCPHCNKDHSEPDFDGDSNPCLLIFAHLYICFYNNDHFFSKKLVFLPAQK